MEESYEHLVFIKELGRLIMDYFNCNDSRVKQQIHKDIELLGRVIG